MKYNHTKHVIQQFVYDLKVPGKMIGLSDEPVIDHFKEAFPHKIESQLLQIWT